MFLNISKTEKIPLAGRSTATVRILGNPKLPKVVFLHGHSMNSKMLVPYVLPFLNKNCFILPDTRGFGATPIGSVSDKDILKTFSDDLRTILKNLDIEEFKLCGISTGALIGMKYLQDKTNRKPSSFLIAEHGMQPINTPGRNVGACPIYQDSQMLELLSSMFQKEIATVDGDNYVYSPDSVSYSSMTPAFREIYEFCVHSILAPTVSPLLRIPIRLPFYIPFMKSHSPVFDCWKITMIMLSSYAKNKYDFRKTMECTSVPYELHWGLGSKMFNLSAYQDFIKIQKHNKGRIVEYDSGHDFFIVEPSKFIKEFSRFLKTH